MLLTELQIQAKQAKISQKIGSKKLRNSSKIVETNVDEELSFHPNVQMCDI